MKKYVCDGEQYTLEEIKREYLDICRESVHYGENPPVWGLYISAFEEIDTDS